MIGMIFHLVSLYIGNNWHYHWMFGMPIIAYTSMVLPIGIPMIFQWYCQLLEYHIIGMSLPIIGISLVYGSVSKPIVPLLFTSK